MFLLALAETSKARIYIFDDFISGIPRRLREKPAGRLEKLQSKDNLIIDITTTDQNWLENDIRLTIAYDGENYKVLQRS